MSSFLSEYGPDALRYHLTAETPDIATRDWDNREAGRVPEPGNPSRSSAKGLDNEDRALLETVEARLETVGEL